MRNSNDKPVVVVTGAAGDIGASPMCARESKYTPVGFDLSDKINVRGAVRQHYDTWNRLIV